MSIGDERRASGKAMVDSRKASGKAVADDRRASGKAMESDRRQSGLDMASERRASGKAFRDDLRALADSETENKALPPAQERPPIPAARGVATYTRPAQAGGGIASPLTEVEAGEGVSSREYYEDQAVYFYSSDYLLAVEIKPLKTLRMIDADGSAATFEFKLPPPSEVL